MTDQANTHEAQPKEKPDLGLKIENMLDKLMDDIEEEEDEGGNENDGESLKFSDEISEEDKFQEEDEFKLKNFFFNCPSQNENHEVFHKINEFNPIQNTNNINYMNNYVQNNFNSSNVNNNINNFPYAMNNNNNYLNIPTQNMFMFKNSPQFVNFGSNFSNTLNSTSFSSNFAMNTYINNNSSHNDSNINYEKTLVFNDNSNSLISSDFQDFNSSYNSAIGKNNKFFFRRNKKYHNTCYPYSNFKKVFNPNEVYNNPTNNNGNYYNKLYNNLVAPIGNNNVELEMILMDVNKVLIKIEKIDQMIYNKLQGKFEQIIKTHKGSRIFQNYLKNTHNDILHQIFNELKGKLSELLKDNYANYFCKKFFGCLCQKDRIEFLTTIQNDLCTLAIDSTATYPIQGILEQLGSKNEKKIIYMGLKNSINSFSYNIYGTHVLEKMLSYFEDEFIQEIIEFVYNNFINLAYHINGICIVKKLLLMTHKKELHQKLKKVVYDNALNLIVHPYGNYVIQVIVENWDDNELVDILEKYKGKYVSLSLQKYSSNVLERIIEKNEKNLDLYINEICAEKNLSEVIKNNYGNYVVQKAIKLASGKNYERLFKEINQNIHKLEDKKIIMKWEMILSSCAKN